MIVEVKPIDTSKWHGKKGKESFAQPNTIEVLYDAKTGAYATGLNEEDQKRLEGLTKLDLSGGFNPDKAHPYWSTQAARIKLPNHTVVFDTTRPTDEIKVFNMKASKFVANSLKEWEDGLYPEATHVIFSEEQEVEMKAGKVQKRNKCYQIASGMSKDAKLNIIQILSNKSLRGRSDNFVDVEIDEIITNQPDDFIMYSNMDSDEVYTRAAVMEAIHRNVLTKEGAAVHYMGDKLSHDLDGAVKYFMDPQNQNLKVAILAKLNK